MADKSLLFVANWKMEMSINQTIDFCQYNLDGFVDLSQSLGQKIVLCPTFPALGFIMVIIEHTPIILGAQNCSEFVSGAYTGQVSASSLAEVGCRYCIIGHSEQRLYNHETDECVARKARMLLNAQISPIICVGETDDICDVASTLRTLGKQLEHLKEYMVDVEQTAIPLIIAYEPVWAIGSGRVPSTQYVKKLYENLDILCRDVLPETFARKFLYGGSVNENSIKQLLGIDLIDGFLIGGASLDFQKFKNLVSLCC